MLWVYYFLSFDSAEDNQALNLGPTAFTTQHFCQQQGGGEYYIPPHKDLFSKVVQ
jgi:hypothetical protein